MPPRNNFLSFIHTYSRQLFLVAGLLLCYLLYAPALHFDFVYNWDDNINVTANDNIKNFSAEGIRRIFDLTQPINEPRLTLFTYAAEYSRWSLNPTPYHLNNILLHLLNILMLFFVVRKFSGNKNIALIAALLFAFHPLRTESVTWVSGRKDMLYAFFFFASMLMYAAYVKGKKNLLLLLGSFILAYASLLSKIQAFSIPAVFFLIDYHYSRKFSASMVYEKLLLAVIFFIQMFHLSGLLVLVAGMAVLRYYRPVLSSLSLRLKSGSLHFRGFLKNVLFSSALLTVVPAAVALLAFFLLRPFNPILGLLFVLVAGVFIFWEIFTAWLHENIDSLRPWYKRVLGREALIVIFVALAAVPLLFLIFRNRLLFWESDFSQLYTFGERLLMGAYAFIFYLRMFFIPYGQSAIHPYPGEIGSSLPSYFIWYAIAAVLVISALIIVLILWKSQRKLLIFWGGFYLFNIGLVLHIMPIEGRVIVAERYTYLAYTGLMALAAFGIAGITKAFSPVRKKIMFAFFTIVLLLFAYLSSNRIQVWKDGITLFTDVIRSYPEYPLAYTNRGTLYLNQQRLQEAVRDFDMALRYSPHHELALYNRALANSYLGNYRQALTDTKLLLKLRPDFADAWYLSGFCKNKIGKYDGAIKDYDKAIEIQPQMFMAYYNRGNARKNMRDYMGALFDYDKSIKINPYFHESYNGRAVAYFFLGNYQASLRDYNKAIELKPDETSFYYNRGLSLQKLNRLDEACSDWSRAAMFGHADAKKMSDDFCKK